MIYIGIDPGKTGAIAAIEQDNLRFAFTFSNWKDMNRETTGLPDCFICIEKLWGMPLRGCQGNFALGENYGAWKALLEMKQLPFIEAAPATWQPKILNTSKKKSKETKILSLQYVNKRYPALNLPMKTAKDISQNCGVSDAICLALYARAVHTNLIK